MIRFPLAALDDVICDTCDQLPPFGHIFWHTHSERYLWRELAVGILGSRVRNDVVQRTVSLLDEAQMFSQGCGNTCLDQLEADAVAILARSYPYYRRGASYLRRAVDSVRREYGGSLSALLKSAIDMGHARRLLINNVVGIGPKQASLFLRNIGYATRIAILDSHVLQYMSMAGVSCSNPRTVATVPGYERLERRFIARAQHFGYSPCRFDIAVWIVMRIAKEQSRLCK